MKKRIKTKQLGRDRAARKALFQGLVQSLVKEEQINTTQAKAKAVQSIFEKYLTKAKTGSLVARRDLQGFLQNKSLVKKMVDELAPRFKKSKGGYTKITIVGNRRGDNARIVRLSLADQKTPKEPTPQKKSTSKPASKSTKPSPKPPVEAPTDHVKTPSPAPKTVNRSGSRGDR